MHLKKEDIEQIISTKQSENNRLEYKREESLEGQTSEIAKDLSSFANAYGGNIIYGIDNDVNLIGVEKSRIDLYKKKIASIIKNSISGLIHVRDDEIEIDGKFLLVLYIQMSYTAPHMVLKLKKFYHRTLGSNEMYEPITMDESQVSKKYEDRFSISKNLDDRVDDKIRKSINILGRSSFGYCIVAIPIIKNDLFNMKQDDFDNIFLIKSSIKFPKIHTTQILSTSFYGFYFSVGSSGYRRRLEIDYDGTISYLSMEGMNVSQNENISLKDLSESVIDFIRFVKELYENKGNCDSFVFAISPINKQTKIMTGIQQTTDFSIPGEININDSVLIYEKEFVESIYSYNEKDLAYRVLEKFIRIYGISSGYLDTIFDTIK